MLTRYNVHVHSERFGICTCQSDFIHRSIDDNAVAALTEYTKAYGQVLCEAELRNDDQIAPAGTPRSGQSTTVSRHLVHAYCRSMATQ